jgi:hypothetical protein
MLMPRRLGGSFGATSGLFRVLLCRAGGHGFCGAAWTANDSHALADHLRERGVHEAICSSGALNGVPVT